jgi:hypothetical protein
VAHAESLEALVLKTYDVGEADRFCILFTRERGRIAARAAGARRPKSKLGGLLLPFQHLELRAEEARSGWIITSATVKSENPPAAKNLRRFGALQEITELLLRFIPHEGALPDVFETTAAFFQSDATSSTPCTLKLLHHLGFLPGNEELTDHFHLGEAERRYVECCRDGTILENNHDHSVIDRLMKLLLEPHLSAPLQAAPIAAQLG